MIVARNDASELGPPTLQETSAVRRKSEELSATMAYAPGDLIAGRYRLTSILAQGGMGIVWKARHETTGRDVAVKLPHVIDGEWAESTKQLLFEATTAASLRHAAIVEILHFGVAEDDRPFIAMELLEGRSLRETIQRTGGLRAEHAVRALLPILDALRYAHARGIVHCDVKPENILLRELADAPTPKLIDFGIARIEGAEARTLDGESVSGSPAYMSPERVQGRSSVGALSDLWAFTIVLYEAISGARPWNAENGLALQRAIVRGPAASLVGLRGVDEALWSILKRGLEKNPRARWQSCAELAEALVRWLRSHGRDSTMTAPLLAGGCVNDNAEREVSRDGRGGRSERFTAIPTLRSATLPGARDTVRRPTPRGNVFWCVMTFLTMACASWMSRAAISAGPALGGPTRQAARSERRFRPLLDQAKSTS